MRRILLAVLLLGLPAMASEPAESVPVVVELFTSEGCSSCPAADAALASLARVQPVSGATIVPLGFHVDYWNYLGWRDPFSSVEFSRRQEDYARAFRGDGTYTPQMIVDGRNGFVGDEGRAKEAVAAAARHSKKMLAVTVRPTGSNGAEVVVGVRSDDVAGLAPGKQRLHVAVTEDNLVTRVERGENAGRSLPHSAVVRVFATLQMAPTGTTTTQVALDPAWKRQDLKFVAFLQHEASREISAVGWGSFAADSVRAARTSPP